MQKIVRFLISGVLIIGLMLVVINQVGFAQGEVKTGQQSTNLSGEPGFNLDDDEPGSVKPPSGKPTLITSPGTYSIGGVCVLNIKSLGKDVTVSVKFKGKNVVGNIPDGWRFLAGVCHVTFLVKNKPVSQVSSSQAGAELCFASIPNASGLIRLNTGKNDWNTLGTLTENGLSCSQASTSGDYLLAESD